MLCVSLSYTDMEAGKKFDERNVTRVPLQRQIERAAW